MNVCCVHPHQADLRGQIDLPDCPAIVLVMTSVNICPSSIIAQLFKHRERVVLVGLQPAVIEVLKLLSMLDYFHTAATLEDGIELANSLTKR